MKRKYLSLFLFLVLILNFLFYLPIASASYTLENWDSYNTGIFSGNNSFIEWERYQGDDFITVDTTEMSVKSSPNCLRVNDDDVGGTGGWINITNTVDYAEGLRLNLRLNMHHWNNAHDQYINFYNSTGDVIIQLWIDIVGGSWSNSGINYYHVTSGWIELWGDFTSADNDATWIFEIRKNSAIHGNGCDYNLKRSTVWFNETSVTNNYNDWTDIAYMKWWNTGSSDGGSGYLHVWLDDIVSIDEAEEGGIGKTIYVNLLDYETGEQLILYGTSFIGPELPPFVRFEVYSDLWSEDYNPHIGDVSTLTLSGLSFTDANYYHLNFTFTTGYVNGETRTYLNSNNYFQLYNGQTYTIYIGEQTVFGGYDNSGQGGGWFMGLEYGDAGFRELATDKLYYAQGESVNFRYVAPNPTWLFNYGSPASHYYIWIYDNDRLGFLWWQTDGGYSADNHDYLEDWAVALTDTYHYLHWDYDPTETFGYKTVTGGVDEYHVFIGHGGGGLFGIDYWLARIKFYITTDTFTPSGNFTSVSPSNPEIGQFTNISWNANNNGYITVRNVLAPGEQEQTITNFMKFTGIEHVNKQFWEFGSYELKLYVNGGLEYEVVDTYTFDITDINGTYGSFGYGIEFLMAEPERVIAGYDMIFINYRSLDSTGVIKVIDSRGQTTSYGALVGEKRGVLNISLPNHASIGEWNVSLTTANNTLYTSFHVIAEENNWVEFYSNVYLENSQFELKLKHDKKIELVFLKDGQEIGTDWYLDVGQMPAGIYPVPLDRMPLSPGSWTVEMWQVNNFVKIKKLAEDNCIVEEISAGSITEGGYDDIFSMLTIGASSIASGGFGLAFMAILIILVVIVMLAQLKLGNDVIFFSAIITALFMSFIGWLPIWIVVISIVLAGLLFSSAFSKKLKIGS